MNISGISDGSSASALSAVPDVSLVAPTGSIPPPNGSSTGSVSISKPGELMSKLKQLEQSDPAKFKEVVSQISQELKTAAGSATGDQAKVLTKLSDGFAQAASSGDLSALQPAQGSQQGGAASGGHHHHHHHHGGGGGQSAAQSSDSSVQAALSSALDEVNQALGASATPAH